MVTEIDENGSPNGTPKQSKSKPWASKVVFLRFCRVSNLLFFYELLVRQEVGPKSRMSVTLADNLVPRGSFGRGRREKRWAGVEEEKGLLRTVDCVFKRVDSWLSF